MSTVVVIKRSYKGFEQAGVAVLGVAGLLSALSIIAWIAYIVYSARIRAEKHQSTRTYVGVYFICFLVADLIKSIGEVVNLQWAANGAVEVGNVCSFQGIARQLGGVATSIWSVVIALHLFNLLFWRWEPRKYSCYATCLGCWSLAGMVAFIGPTVVRTNDKGDFWGIAGYWCWITQPYSSGRIVLEYLWMFLSSAISFILYSTILLRLRGNIYTVEGHWRIRWISTENSWRLKLTQDNVDAQIIKVVRILLWFPVLYIFTVLPMAICRWVEDDDLFVPFTAVFITNIPFSLSGLLTVSLFYFADRALPTHEELPSFVVPRKEMTDSVAETGVEPFVLPAPPRPQMMQTPADALALPSTRRSRWSAYSLGMARTQPPSPTPPSAARVPPTPGRSRSADSLSMSSTGLGLKYKAKWQGGYLQLSHSNLRPEGDPKSRTP